MEREVRALQSLAVRADQWTPPIVKTVATEGQGIPELLAQIRNYESHLRGQGLLLSRRTQNWERRLIEMLRDRMLEQARARVSDGQLARFAAEVAEHKRDPYSLVEEIAGGIGAS